MLVSPRRTSRAAKLINLSALWLNIHAVPGNVHVHSPAHVLTITAYQWVGLRMLSHFGYQISSHIISSELRSSFYRFTTRTSHDARSRELLHHIHDIALPLVPFLRPWVVYILELDPRGTETNAKAP